ncbi:hypothetical protein ILUMI_12157 [Ignelater luminosus]|uniref:DDE-1 domain-containing protein n=1 Tax=Ignelater luminosus TaxID=2038154 RepID=A0A8K0CZ52_IGNLU|nr:hypothetical protein ILUMI_12157 [Ignelater luminosus]
MVFQVASRNGIQHPFKEDKADPAWMDLFLQRHKQTLSIRKPCGTSFGRALEFNKDNGFFKLLEEAYKKYNFFADRVYNVDKTGLTTVQSKKRKRQIAALTSAERRSTITVIASMIASRHYVPPLVILPRKNINNQHERDSSWVNWSYTSIRMGSGQPLYYLVQAFSIDVIDLAKSNHVTIILLPLHCTQKLQQLDKTLMGPLKARYSEEIRLPLTKATFMLGNEGTLWEGLSESANWRDRNADCIALLYELEKSCSFWTKLQKENQEESSDDPPANLADSSLSLNLSLEELQSSSSKSCSSSQGSQPSTSQGACHIKLLNKMKNRIATKYMKKRLNFEGEETNKRIKVKVEKTKKKKGKSKGKVLKKQKEDSSSEESIVDDNLSDMDLPVEKRKPEPFYYM